MSAFDWPSKWSTTTLGDIARRKASNGIFRKSNEYLNSKEASEGLPVVWLAELFSGNAIDCSNARRLRPTAKEIESYGLQRGDLLFCRSSLNQEGIGYSNVYRGEDWAALFECHLIRISPNLNIADPYYLNHYLRSASARRFIESRAKTSTMTTIDQGGISAIPVPLPPLSEQRRIAAILDKADVLRAKRREALAQLDSLAQSTFVEMFGDPMSPKARWQPVPVSSFVAGFESGKSVAAEDEEDSSSQYRVLKVSAVTSLEFKPSESKAAPPDHAPQDSHFVRRGDLLFSRANTTELIGATAYVVDTPDNLLLPDKLWRFVWHDAPRATPHFVNFLFRQPKVRAEIGRRASGSSGSMKNISQEKVMSIEAALPPLSLQQEFSGRIEKIMRMKEIQVSATDAADTLFASLQHRAFRGEL